MVWVFEVKGKSQVVSQLGISGLLTEHAQREITNNEVKKVKRLFFNLIGFTLIPLPFDVKLMLLYEFAL